MKNIVKRYSNPGSFADLTYQTFQVSEGSLYDPEIHDRRFALYDEYPLAVYLIQFVYPIISRSHQYTFVH